MLVKEQGKFPVKVSAVRVKGARQTHGKVFLYQVFQQY